MAQWEKDGVTGENNNLRSWKGDNILSSLLFFKCKAVFQINTSRIYGK